MVKIEDIVNKLREVTDPELGYDIISLGEIEDVREENGEYIIKFLHIITSLPIYICNFRTNR
ncbi:iron-sulfur cluster assembly protein [Candidatus Nanopusillus massiliensis]|uniref:iron-sulfur cluster assembly protein n=1 Tax=Candidatus Nanopusillus massiliensis TaxID=2897163 RepID=UPI001E407B77|nr:iron-sulfur cluster assembly protein [Candidatus Nanopusillus massiliensis]